VTLVFHPASRGEVREQPGIRLANWLDARTLTAFPPPAMSDEASDFPDLPEVPTEAAPRVRRISNKRAKKVAKPEPVGEPATAAEPTAAPSSPEEESPVPSAAISEAPGAPGAPAAEAEAEAEGDPADSDDGSAASTDWADPETSGGGGGSENAKRKRRRKKGKGGSQAQLPQETVMPLVGAPPTDPGKPAQPIDSNPPTETGESSVTRAEEGFRQDRPQRERAMERPPQGQSSQQNQQQQQPPQQRFKIDSEELAKRAWKIYLAEVSEEGVALIGDSDARELSRRCFRLAEIFLEEQSRRR